MSKLLPSSGFKWRLHNDYPLAPDKKEIKRDMLSEYQLPECLPFFIKKSMYFHYKNLQLYLRLGLKLRK